MVARSRATRQLGIAEIPVPEPIPLFLFAEAREDFGEPLTALLVEDEQLDEAMAALRTFALVDCETIIDERDPAITTVTIRLHRLVREIAAARRAGEAREDMRRVLVRALAAIYPQTVLSEPKTWPRARRLDGLALAQVGGDASVPKGSSASKWTGTGVPRNAGFLPMILPINRSLVGARVERFSSARRRRGARFEKQSKKIKWCKVDGHVVDPIGANRTLGPL